MLSTERTTAGAVAAAGAKPVSLRDSARRDTALVGAVGDDGMGEKAIAELAEATAGTEAARAAETDARVCTAGTLPLAGKGSAFRKMERDAAIEGTENGAAARCTLSLPLSTLRDTGDNAAPTIDDGATLARVPLKTERLTGANAAGKVGGAGDETAARAIQTAPADERGADARDTEATGAACIVRETLGPSKSETSASMGAAERRRRTKYGVMLSMARCIPARYRPETCAARSGGDAVSGLRFIVGAVGPIARIAEAGAIADANGVKAAIGAVGVGEGTGGIRKRRLTFAHHYDALVGEFERFH